MGNFMAYMYIFASVVFILTLSVAVFIFIVDSTKIGSAIYNYICSKIIKESKE